MKPLNPFHPTLKSLEYHIEIPDFGREIGKLLASRVFCKKMSGMYRKRQHCFFSILKLAATAR